MQFAQLVVTDEQALMTRAALDIVLNDPERYVMTDEEREGYERLALFFGRAAVDPGHFPLTGKSATRIKSIVRKAKGPAQPQSRRNKRKARQERRQSFAKKRRKQNREFRDEYNAAMAKLAEEREEMEAAYAEIQERIANEPKFVIVDGQGQLIMSDIPESAIVKQSDFEELVGVAGTTAPEELRDVAGLAPGELQDAIPAPARVGDAPKIILPGTAEALGLE